MLMKITPQPAAAVPTTAADGYPATQANSVAKRIAAGVKDTRSPIRSPSSSRRSASVRWSTKTRCPTTVRPASVSPAMIAVSAITAVKWPKSTTPR